MYSSTNHLTQHMSDPVFRMFSNTGINISSKVELKTVVSLNFVSLPMMFNDVILKLKQFIGLFD